MIFLANVIQLCARFQLNLFCSFALLDDTESRQQTDTTHFTLVETNKL